MDRFNRQFRQFRDISMWCHSPGRMPAVTTAPLGNQSMALSSGSCSVDTWRAPTRKVKTSCGWGA